jgi:hypothetical protein
MEVSCYINYDKINRTYRRVKGELLLCLLFRAGVNWKVGIKRAVVNSFRI